jgi:hypothetical protein
VGHHCGSHRREAASAATRGLRMVHTRKEEPVFLSVESHSAKEMAPKLRSDKLDTLIKLREAVLTVSPDCLWRMRGDGKITFTPLPHKDRSKFRNIMIVHLQESPVSYRIGKEVVRFSDERLPDIEMKLKQLLAERQ